MNGANGRERLDGFLVGNGVRDDEMDGRVATAVAVFVLTASAVAAVPVGGTPSDEARGFGATISSFMQSSAAKTQGSVENGMWSAEFENASSERRERMVQSRSSALERKVERLKAERAELLNESDDGLTPEERAKAARLAAHIETLNDAIEDTEHAAKTAGVDLQQLDELRTKAKDLSGPEVAELARGQASRTGNAGSPTGTDGGFLSDVPGIGDEGPPGQRDENGTANETDDDGDAPGEADHRNGSNASENDSGNSSQKRSGDADENAEDGPNTPTPESNSTDTQRNESAAREGNRSEGNESQGERNGRNDQRGSSTSGDENSTSNNGNFTSGDQNSTSGDENASDSNRSGQ